MFWPPTPWGSDPVVSHRAGRWRGSVGTAGGPVRNVWAGSFQVQGSWWRGSASGVGGGQVEEG